MRKYITIGGLVLLVLIAAFSVDSEVDAKSGGTIHTPALANYYLSGEDFVFKFESSGTWVDKKGQLWIRFDLYPQPGTLAYAYYEHTPNRYPGEKDKEGKPIDVEGYTEWLNSPPRPFIYFMTISDKTVPDDIYTYISSAFDIETMIALDNALVKPGDNTREISNLLRAKYLKSDYRVSELTNKDIVITITNSKFIDAEIGLDVAQ